MFHTLTNTIIYTLTYAMAPNSVRLRQLKMETKFNQVLAVCSPYDVLVTCFVH